MSPAIETRGLRKRFGGLVAVDGVDLQAAAADAAFGIDARALLGCEPLDGLEVAAVVAHIRPRADEDLDLERRLRGLGLRCRRSARAECEEADGRQRSERSRSRAMRSLERRDTVGHRALISPGGTIF